jgi:hypothetical protein
VGRDLEHNIRVQAFKPRLLELLRRKGRGDAPDSDQYFALRWHDRFEAGPIRVQRKPKGFAARAPELDLATAVEGRGASFTWARKAVAALGSRYERTASPGATPRGHRPPIGTLALSGHIGLILTKLPDCMVAYIKAQPAFIQQRWRRKLWLGFSAEDQTMFDERWAHMRQLAEEGWVIFVCIAPMLDPVRLSDDFLKLGRWAICSGEEGLEEHVRYMQHSWARAVRDQCAAAGIPFFMKQLADKKPIPPDLLIRQFPAL